MLAVILTLVVWKGNPNSKDIWLLWDCCRGKIQARPSHHVYRYLNFPTFSSVCCHLENCAEWCCCLCCIWIGNDTQTCCSVTFWLEATRVKMWRVSLTTIWQSCLKMHKQSGLLNGWLMNCAPKAVGYSECLHSQGSTKVLSPKKVKI